MEIKATLRKGLLDSAGRLVNIILLDPQKQWQIPEGYSLVDAKGLVLVKEPEVSSSVRDLVAVIGGLLSSRGRPLSQPEVASLTAALSRL